MLHEAVAGGRAGARPPGRGIARVRELIRSVAVRG
jgi:hypothetical protein